MSNPTSNFNWQMPTATDLVTDLPADFEVFGQAVDTSLADLKGGTSGQVLAKNSNTDMDFVWVAQDDSNAIQNAIVDAKGDLIAATAADTPARLAVGANDTVLTADSTTATGLKWAAPVTGGMTLLSSTTTNTGSSYTISSISQDYINLMLIWQVLSVSNADETITIGFAGGTGTGGGVKQDAVALGLGGAGNFRIVNQAQASGNCAQMWIYNYTAAASKPLQSVSPGVSAAYRGSGFMGFTDYASAITTFTVTLSGGSFTAGTLKVYGVK